mgnify:CR=1 FL=1
MAGIDTFPVWGQSPPVVGSEPTIAGNKSLKYTFGALYQGGSELAFEISGFSRDMVFTLQGLIVLFSGAMAQVAAFTLLNPHVYLDTVMLMGSIGAQQPAGLRGWFIAGSSLASLVWFCGLGFGARWLAPLFAKPRAWQVLDGLIGLTMWALSVLLLRHALRGT